MSKKKKVRERERVGERELKSERERERERERVKERWADLMKFKCMCLHLSALRAITMPWRRLH